MKSIKVDTNAWAFVASPLRAIADLVFIRKEVTWEKDGLGFLTDSLRIEEDDLRQLDLHDFDEICESFRNLRTKAYMKCLRKELEK